MNLLEISSYLFRDLREFPGDLTCMCGPANLYNFASVPMLNTTRGIEKTPGTIQLLRALKMLYLEWWETISNTFFLCTCSCKQESFTTGALGRSCCFCEARRASHCHSPQTTFSSNSTCCVLSTQKSAMHVVVYVDRLTTQHSIVDIVHWSWSYWQFCYPRWHVECFWAALAAHWISSASHTSVLPQHPRRKIVPCRVGWNHHTSDYYGKMCPLIDTWLNMLTFSVSAYCIFHF